MSTVLGKKQKEANLQPIRKMSQAKRTLDDALNKSESGNETNEYEVEDILDERINVAGEISYLMSPIGSQKNIDECKSYS